MRNRVIYCPHLKRDLTQLYAQVPDLQLHLGVQTPRGEDGCLDCHKAIVREAQAVDAPYVWVLEDDCQLTPAFHLARWRDAILWADDAGYDVLVGGSTRTYDEQLVCDAPRMIGVSAFHSAHCVVYFRRGYEKILRAVQPFDLSLGRDCGCQCVLVHPFVAVQRAAFSGILQQEVNYVPLYERHEQALAELFHLPAEVAPCL